MTTLHDSRVLVVGAGGQIAPPLVEHLAATNEVVAVARFTRPEQRERLDAAGARTLAIDLDRDGVAGLPADIDYLLHFAAYQPSNDDFDGAMRINAELTGLVMQHCRTARAALVMSTHSVYRPHEDPYHVFDEATSPIGDCRPTHSPPYSATKIAQEGVARTCARLFDLPTVICRMNAAYDDGGGLPIHHLTAIARGVPVPTRWDPCTYSPIHQDDINAQVGGLLAAADVPATIVNWAGDEAVSVQEWSAYMAELLGVEHSVTVTAHPGTLRGSIASNTRRLGYTGPCTVGWREGLARAVALRQGSP